MAWDQLFGGGHPYGTYANMADRYPADMAREQNRDIGLGAIMPFANLMRPTVDAAKAVYNWLPDSSTTQARKFKESQQQRAAGGETNPLIRNALSPPSLPAPSQPQLRPSNLPRTDQAFISSLPNPARNIGDSAYGNPEIPGVNKVAGQSGGISSLPAPSWSAFSGAYPTDSEIAAGPARGWSAFSGAYPTDSEIAAGPARGQRAGLQQQGYSPIPSTDLMRQVTYNTELDPSTNEYRVIAPGQVAGTTDYRMPGKSAMGGTEPGYATFQGLPKAGGYLRYVGTPETQGMTQEQATAYNVGNINRQIEALRSEREAYNPGITQGGGYAASLPAPPTLGNPFALPGSNRLDDAVRQQTLESALKNALDPNSKMTGKQRQAAIDGYQAAIAPALQAYKQQTDAYGSGLNYLANIGQQNVANQRAQLDARTAQNRLAMDNQFNRDKLAMDQSNADRNYQLDYATKGPKSAQYINNAMGAYQKMTEAQRGDAENELLSTYFDAQKKGDKATVDKLKPLAEMFYKYRGNNDPFAIGLQQPK